jgi:hypothetical protein
MVVLPRRRGWIVRSWGKRKCRWWLQKEVHISLEERVVTLMTHMVQISQCKFRFFACREGRFLAISKSQKWDSCYQIWCCWMYNLWCLQEYIYIYRTDVIVILKELILSLLKCCVAHPSSLCHVVIPQDGWGKTALVKESVHTIQQDQSLQDNHNHSTCDYCIVLPISHNESCPRCLWLVAYISHLWDLVCHFLDSWSVPQVVSYQPRDLPG